MSNLCHVRGTAQAEREPQRMFDIAGHFVSARLGCGDDMPGRMPEQLLIADHALDERTHLIEVEGPVDLYSAPELQECTRRVIGDGKTSVLIDLSRVGFMDSTGLSVLVDTLKRLRAARAELLLIVSDYDVERLFELSGLYGAFRIYRSREEALEHRDRTS